jgi:hypothetical protein
MQAPDECTAEATAIAQFDLDQEERKASPCGRNRLA